MSVNRFLGNSGVHVKQLQIVNFNTFLKVLFAFVSKSINFLN
jgi:hypothetical protein